MVSNKNKNSNLQLWVFLVLFCAVFGLLWFSACFHTKILSERINRSFFYKVSNRDFSLFLWQNPEFMRANAYNKLGYLPHFNTDQGVQVIPELADQHVSVPSDVLYRYHIWKLLLGKSLANRPINVTEFKNFLRNNPEWYPQYWSKSTPAYKQFIDHLDSLIDVDLQNYSYKAFPLKVRMAFQGWKNYFFEWDDIKEVRPTIEQMKTFLEEHPGYKRCLWRNLLLSDKPDYLKPFWGCRSPPSSNDSLNDDELSNFLKAGFYNYSKAAY